jgi:hypothetical protein
MANANRQPIVTLLMASGRLRLKAFILLKVSASFETI